MPQDLPLTVKDAAAALRAGSVSSVQLTEGFLNRISLLNESLGAFVAVCGESALKAAEAADWDFAAGVDRGLLQGIPLAVKDIIATEDAPTTANSRVLDPEWGKGVDAPVVARLRAAGTVVLGKSTTSEFAIGLPDPDKGFLIPRNPWNLDHTPAGSSSGTGIAVSAGLALGGLGTDTGGSVRGPAAHNGHTGLKVTFGRVPKNGVAPLGYTLDSVGPMARSAYDCAAMLEVMAGYDPGDVSAAQVLVPKYAVMLTGDVEGLRIGVPKEYFGEGLDPEIRGAIDGVLAGLKMVGCVVKPVSLPHTKYAIPTYYVIATAEASSNLSRFDGVRFGLRAEEAKTLSEMYRKTRDEGFGAEVKRRILLGTYALSAGYYDAYYRKAQQVRTLLTRDFLAAFAEVDVLVAPVTPTPAFKLGEKTDDPVQMYLEDIYSVAASLAGICGASVPCGTTKDGLPIGVQVMGKHFDEATMLRVAQAVEKGQMST